MRKGGGLEEGGSAGMLALQVGAFCFSFVVVVVFVECVCVCLSVFFFVL